MEVEQKRRIPHAVEMLEADVTPRDQANRDCGGGASITTQGRSRSRSEESLPSSDPPSFAANSRELRRVLHKSVSRSPHLPVLPYDSVMRGQAATLSACPSIWHSLDFSRLMTGVGGART